MEATNINLKAAPSSEKTGNVASYKCINCGGTLTYNVDKTHMVCLDCSTEYNAAELKKIYSMDDPEKGFNWGSYRRKYDSIKAHMTDTLVFQCSSCGAQIETTSTTASAVCPYCGSNAVLMDRLNGGLRPNGIIPFKIDARDLRKKIADQLKKQMFLPNQFAAGHMMDKIQSVYVPFWAFEATLGGTIALDVIKHRYTSDADYDYTITEHYSEYLSGDMAFSGIPVDASVRMDNDLMDSLEPFDMTELVDFDPAYLSGYMADRFDEEPESSLGRASERMMNSVLSVTTANIDRARLMEGFISGIRANGMSVRSADVRYVLLPVYLTTIHYKGKQYRFAINGQTGKLVGELPVSKFKKWMFSWGLTFAAFAASSFLVSLFLH